MRFWNTPCRVKLFTLISKWDNWSEWWWYQVMPLTVFNHHQGILFNGSYKIEKLISRQWVESYEYMRLAYCSTKVGFIPYSISHWRSCMVCLNTNEQLTMLNYYRVKSNWVRCVKVTRDQPNIPFIHNIAHPFQIDITEWEWISENESNVSTNKYSIISQMFMSVNSQIEFTDSSVHKLYIKWFEYLIISIKNRIDWIINWYQ